MSKFKVGDKVIYLQKHKATIVEIVNDEDDIYKIVTPIYDTPIFTVDYELIPDGPLGRAIYE